MQNLTSQRAWEHVLEYSNKCSKSGVKKTTGLGVEIRVLVSPTCNGTLHKSFHLGPQWDKCRTTEPNPNYGLPVGQPPEAGCREEGVGQRGTPGEGIQGETGPSPTLRNPVILLNEPGIPQGDQNRDKQNTKELLLLPHPHPHVLRSHRLHRFPPKFSSQEAPGERPLGANKSGHSIDPHWPGKAGGGEDKMAEGQKVGGEGRQEKERAKLAGTSRQQGPAGPPCFLAASACDLMAGAWGWGDGGEGHARHWSLCLFD